MCGSVLVSERGVSVCECMCVSVCEFDCVYTSVSV